MGIFKTTFTGFVDDAAYRYPLTEVIKEYEDKFPGIESIQLDLNGVRPSLYQNFFRETYYSKDGKSIRLNFTQMPGDEFTIVSHFRMYMNNEVIKYLKYKQAV